MNLGPKAHKWLHTMLNTCFIENKTPKIWRQSEIIAILKPGKDSAIPKNYRPISLLCHTYKLYERLILNRASPLLEQHLIKEQAGFRPGKSCTRWRKQKNGLPQGSVLSPILFNIYTNDQLIHNGTRTVMYADDLCVKAQYSSFTEVETTIGDALDELTQYYRSNSLRANPDNTQVTSFHLRNKEANRSLKVEWNRTELENTPHSKYLGVTLDRTLSYKEHIHNKKMKVATRNNLLRKLSNSKWEQMQLP